MCNHLVIEEDRKRNKNNGFQKSHATENIHRTKTDEQKIPHDKGISSAGKTLCAFNPRRQSPSTCSNVASPIVILRDTKDFDQPINKTAMEELYETYHRYDPSDRCWLDGQYFKAVFADYPGFTNDPLIINLDGRGSISGPTHFDLNPRYVTLVRVKIRGNGDGGRNQKNGDSSNSPNTIKHSNLIIIDSSKREIYRFEPMLEHRYYNEIHNLLKSHMAKVLPDYRFVELSNHPQTYDEACSDQGMCVAYTIKAGVLFALGVEGMADGGGGRGGKGGDESPSPSSSPNNSPREPNHVDIKRFAAAVEHIFSV